MSKNKKILIFSGIAVIILAAVTVVLLLTAPAEKADDGGSDLLQGTESTSSSVYLSEKSASDVAKITVTNSSGTFVIAADGGDGNGNGFTIAELAGAPLNAASLKSAAGYAAEFEAKEFVEEVSDSADLAKYGLTSPTAEVKTEFTDGTSFEFRIGIDVPNTASSAYMTSDGRNVYTCYKSRIGSFTQEKYDFIEKTVFPECDSENGEEVNKLTVERIDFDEPLIIESIAPEEEDGIQVYAYRLTSPYTAYADLADAPNFMVSLFGLNADKAVLVGLNDEYREKAGLNDPNCVVTVETNLHTYTLTLGSAFTEKTVNDDGSETEKVTGFYGVSSELPDVLYVFNYSDITAARIQPKQLMSKLFLMPYIYSLESLEYSDSDGRSFTLGFETIKGEEYVDENGEMQTTDDKHFHYLNGELGVEQRIKDMYQYFIGAAGEELYFDEDKGDLLATVTYTYANKKNGIDGKDVVRFYKSNSDRKVIINLNGENIFKTRQMYVTQLFANAENFLNGGEIVLTY